MDKDDQERELIPVENVLVSERPHSITGSLPKSQGLLILFALVSSNLFALLLGWLFEFLSLRGVVNVAASRLMLIGAWGTGVLIVCLWAWGTNIKPKITIAIAGSVLLAALLWVLDAWAPKPSKSPNEIVLEAGRALLKEWKIIEPKPSSLYGVVVLDTSKLYPFLASYRVVLICVAAEGTDPKLNKSLSIGEISTLNPSDTKLSALLTSATKDILLRPGPGSIFFFALLVRKDFSISSITSVQDAIDKGALLIAEPRMDTSGPSKNALSMVRISNAFESSPPQAGKPVKVNVLYESGDPTIKLHLVSAIYPTLSPLDDPIPTSDWPKIAEAMWKHFIDRKETEIKSRTIPSGPGQWHITLSSTDSLTPRMATDLLRKNGRTILWIVGRLEWKTSDGNHEYDFCFLTIGDPKEQHWCESHNGMYSH